MGITASEIAQLRAKTGAGMMDCKNALEEAAGNMDQAIDILRKKGIAKAAKRADKITAEGLVYSYIHGEGRIGVLLELNCETDFVAKTDQFKNLANDIAMHIAATNPKYLSKEDVNIEEIEREKDIYRAQLKNEGKPEEMIEKILEGKMSRYYTEVCLLEQAFIKDEEKTIIQLLNEKTGEIGEKISLRRFVRFELGEGIEKVCKDFAEEVREQMEV
ncbi:MAG TPA: translation elongation factor Ts [Candidatus Magasanikbacteria bacterium]|jgi:elongation factor Ts|nr:translation elongation factor Ts [Candidatus Magasanikbacteria bacterium]HQF57525.1 translation elongation factor Ts [Candidatus Magasanikbacteria bacterium]HQL52977.1 translation elongation factor Ts [Candidatus Magasanikbacteria bacterium]